uniref:Uncharacterized protein n=1 Tax=Pristionchus pacificus TaxID=54126 RepID=A0A2A6B6Q0_PRIPA|eukprot:PDM61560.1 hypothetical protein PRIPAC_51002 [Pristionchus pacificus]
MHQCYKEGLLITVRYAGHKLGIRVRNTGNLTLLGIALFFPLKLFYRFANSIVDQNSDIGQE